MMDSEFEHMATPLVYVVSLRIVCEDNACHIDIVFGASREFEKERVIRESGEIMRIDTLFPARQRPQTQGGDTQDGIRPARRRTQYAGAHGDAHPDMSEKSRWRR